MDMKTKVSRVEDNIKYLESRIEDNIKYLKSRIDALKGTVESLECKSSK